METLIMYLDTIFHYFYELHTVHYRKHISKYFKYLRHSIQNCELITGVLDRNAKLLFLALFDQNRPEIGKNPHIQCHFKVP